ncbi:hypothetical protein ACFQE1_09570 [Halobium palmae]|uniref:Uncharacterized protein n=1 Tax=Halobium palmae TaxID=1776492 RepID=A0ABD5RYY0_9EURY
MTDAADAAVDDPGTADYDHDSFRAALGAVAGYGLILAAMFLVLFVVPWLLFTVL